MKNSTSLLPAGFFYDNEEDGNNTRILVQKAGHLENLPQILKEVNLVSHLKHHKNILAFGKWLSRGSDVFLYTPIGKTEEDLGNIRTLIVNSFPMGLPEPLISRIFSGLLSALEYLHSEEIVHRGVRADNVFFDSTTETIRLGGFRHAICIRDCDRWIGTNDKVQQFEEDLHDVFIWLAPEVFKQDLRGYGINSDIYSLGVCICEIGNGLPPYYEMEPLQILFEKLRGVTPFLNDSKTMTVSGGFPQNESCILEQRRRTFSSTLHAIVASCLTHDPDQRPTAKKLLEDYALYFEQNLRNYSLKELLYKK